MSSISLDLSLLLRWCRRRHTLSPSDYTTLYRDRATRRPRPSASEFDLLPARQRHTPRSREAAAKPRELGQPCGCVYGTKFVLRAVTCLYAPGRSHRGACCSGINGRSLPPHLFFFNDAAPPEISPLPLHAALPI